jgi:pyruvate,water dikinase
MNIDGQTLMGTPAPRAFSNMAAIFAILPAMSVLSRLLGSDQPDEGAAAARLRRRFGAFQQLLAENNAVLELMADLEEKRSGEFLFDRAYLTRGVEQVTAGVGRIVAHLDLLTGGRYPGLAPAFEAAKSQALRALERRTEIAETGPLTIPLDRITGDDAPLAGGKMAHLGELRNRAGFTVPDGFAISSPAFRLFLAHNGLRERIAAALAGVSVTDLAEIERASADLQEMIRGAAVPPELAAAVAASLAELGLADGGGSLAVRSSAVLEDGELSFAGQYVSILDVPAADVLARYKEVLASLFTPRAVFYGMTKGFAEEELVMAVGVLRMVDARAGGVAYSRDPVDPASDAVVVSAVRGLGTAVVDGSTPHDTYRLARDPCRPLDARVARKEVRFVAGGAGGGLRPEPLPEELRELPALSDAERVRVCEAAVAAERHYGAPQDVEWAFGEDGRLYVLQSRALQVGPGPERPRLPRRIAGHRVLIDGGEIASRGVGAGPVFLLRAEEDLAAFPAGAVLVARNTSTRFVTVMQRAAAIVTDVGGVAGHMASLAREFGVPALLDTGCATTALAPGGEVTVDAFNGTVYEGRVAPLLEYAAQKREPLRETPLIRTLEAALRWIAPLNLTDPSLPEFSAGHCRTLHDVTRFAHEKAMAEMFEAGSERELAEKGTVVLLAGIPVGVHLLDLGGGIRPGTKKAGAADVLSIPLAAVLAGMTSMRWPDPPPVDTGGFLGMVAHTASIPEEQLLQTAEKSFAIVGANYLHFSIRLGYHFSLIEAWVGERLNDNYIRFFFKGGGAIRERRLRRVRLIGEILRLMDFSVRIVDDVVDAALLKYRRADLEERLLAMGKLTAYTKQLDMAMFNDDVTDWYRDEFLRDHWKVGRP